MALSVGGVVALLETMVLISLTVLYLIMHKTIKTFIQSRLLLGHNVPVLQGKDTSPLFLPRSLIKFSRYPGKLKRKIISELVPQKKYELTGEYL